MAMNSPTNIDFDISGDDNLTQGEKKELSQFVAEQAQKVQLQGCKSPLTFHDLYIYIYVLEKRKRKKGMERINL